MSILSKIGPLQWQVPIVDKEGRPVPEFIRYFQQLFGNTTTLDGTKQDADDDLTALAALTGTGMMARTGDPTYAVRTITGGSGVTVTNGDGVAGNPTISITAGGTFSIPILASGLQARITNGAAPGTTETATNKVMLNTYDFDASTNEYVQVMVPMPKSWNEGTVTVQFIWTAASGSGDVVWSVQAVALSDGDALDAAFGTAQSVTDTLIAANDQHTTAFTSAITVGGSPVENDLVVFQIFRNASNGSDTLAVDASLLAIRINVTTNARDDS